MSFADKLRHSMIPLDQDTIIINKANFYIREIKNEAVKAAKEGKNSVAFYIVRETVVDGNDKGYTAVYSLPMYEGTPQQRATAIENAKLKTHDYCSGRKSESFIENLGYEVSDLEEAQKIVNIMKEELQKMDFTKYDVEIKQFHHIEVNIIYNKFFESRTISYKELPSTFYYLYFSISW